MPASLNCYSSSEKDELLDLLEEERRASAKTSFLDFIKAIDIPGAPVNPDDEDCDEFYPERVKPAAHHVLLCRVLQALADGKIKRAMFFLPPGQGKSIYASVAFPPYFMGRNPRQSIIAVSYGQGLARKFGRRCRSVVKSAAYQDIFGHGLSTESSAADEWALTNESNYMARGLGGEITGNRADGGIIDDPVKDQQDADSVAVSDASWDAYNSAFDTRIKPRGWRLVLQTRWSPNDISGRLLPDTYDGRTGMVRCKDDHDWYVVNLPMLCEREDDPLGRKPGDLLWPEWNVFEDVCKIRDNPVRQRDWTALYQQRPSMATGSYFKEEWFKYYETRPAHLRIYGSSDFAVTKKTSSDFTVHGVIGVDPNDDIYVLDVWKQRVETDVGVETMLDMINENKPLAWAADRDLIVNSIGPFLRKRMAERHVYADLRELPLGREDKEMRGQAFKARMAMGKVYFPIKAPWFQDVKASMLAFPHGRHDDDVDMLGLCGRLLDEMVGGSAPTPEREREQQDYVGGSAVSYEYGDDGETDDPMIV